MKCPLCNGTGIVDSTGCQIGLRRRELGLTQAELAQKAGMSRNGIAVIERGGNVTLHSLKAIADALGMELEIRVKKDDTALDAAGGM